MLDDRPSAPSGMTAPKFDPVEWWIAYWEALNVEVEIGEEDADALCALAAEAAKQQARRDAEIARTHARSYGAINLDVTTERRRLDYASENALLTCAQAIEREAK